MSYFASFPQTFYRFGTNEPSVLFQAINSYVAILEDVAEDVNYYTKQQILPGERPDQLSYRIYGDDQFYWTFYVMNKSVRESGWPLHPQTLYDESLKRYPHRTVVTTDNISTSHFVRGAIVTGSSSGTIGKIIERNLELGQVVIQPTVKDAKFSAGEVITTVKDGAVFEFEATGESAQIDSVHHYENAAKDWVDINPYSPSVSGLTPVTTFNRFELKNDDLSFIKCLTPSNVINISNRFRKAMREES